MEFGREFSNHRPRALPFFIASVPLQISAELASVAPQQRSKAAAKDAQSAWELKVEFSPPPNSGSTGASSLRSPKVGPDPSQLQGMVTGLKNGQASGGGSLGMATPTSVSGSQQRQ